MTWKEGLTIKLRSMKSTAGVSLYYVVREDLPATHDFQGDIEEERIHQIRHDGHEWNKDNKRVAQFILCLVQPTDGYEWIKTIPKTNGRAIFQALTRHYQGDNAATTISQAYQTIENLKYTYQYVFSWEVFSTQVKKAYDRLEDHGIAIPTAEKLRIIKTKIMTRNVEFNMLAKSALTYDATGRALTDYLSRVSEHVGAEFPTQQVQGQRYRPNVSAVNVNDEVACMETIGGRTMCNGVDITDKVRKYPPHEWHALPLALRKEIMDAKRSRSNNNGGRGYRGRGRGQRGGDAQSVSTVMTQEGMEDLIQRTTQATIASMTTAELSVITTPTAVDANSTADSNNNKRVTSAVPEGNIKRFRANIRKVHTSNVHRSGQVGHTQVSLLSARNQEAATHTVGYLDEDSHADMHCAGKNCVMLSTTGFSCDVSPFHEQYEARKDVEIVKSATAYQHPTGRVIYIVMNISLWFGNEMEHSLVNGLIARDAGNQFCTDPYDERGLGLDVQRIDNGQELRVAMERRGNKIGVKTYKPSREDVLQAIATDSPNVIYLNPESEYPPIGGAQGVSTL
jgi:hypothetical protein